MLEDCGPDIRYGPVCNLDWKKNEKLYITVSPFEVSGFEPVPAPSPQEQTQITIWEGCPRGRR